MKISDNAFPCMDAVVIVLDVDLDRLIVCMKIDWRERNINSQGWMKSLESPGWAVRAHTVEFGNVHIQGTATKQDKKSDSAVEGWGMGLVNKGLEKKP